MNKNIFIYSFDLKIHMITLFKYFDFYTEAAKFFNCSSCVISRYLNKNILYKKESIFSFSLINL
jgi:hypothetical protein